MNKILIISIATLLFSGCSLIPSAWKSVRSGAVVEPVEELDAQVTQDLETSLDADLNQIDADLKAIDEEALQY